jgi:hypothetical protein
MRFILIVLTGFGSAAFVGGVLSFLFGGWVLRSPMGVNGLGPFNGIWSPTDYCFAGAVLASIGAGFAVAGWLGLNGRQRRETVEY